MIASVAAISGIVLASPAGAATPSWRQVFGHHYGPAADYSAFGPIVAFGTSNVWALGGTDISGGGGTTQQPVIVQWRGKGWTGNQAPAGVPSYIAAASADSASDIWAVTFEDGYVLHYNGVKWTVAKKLSVNGVTGVFTSVVAISPKNVWAFGNSGFGPGMGTWHFDGTTWRHETTAMLGDNIGVASAVSASNIWGIGAATAPADEIERFNGSSWTAQSNSLLTGLTFTGIRAFTPSSIWATGQPSGSATQSYLLHYSNHWSRVLIPWGLVGAGGITADGTGGLWFTAQDSAHHQYLVRWLPGNKWQRFGTSSTTRPGGLANIPGTTSEVLGGSSTLPTTGSSASVWASGTL